MKIVAYEITENAYRMPQSLIKTQILIQRSITVATHRCAINVCTDYRVLALFHILLSLLHIVATKLAQREKGGDQAFEVLKDRICSMDT